MVSDLLFASSFLWFTGLPILIMWLLFNRTAMLSSPNLSEQMAFISLGFGSLATLVFWIAFTVIFIYDGDIWEMLAFIDVVGYFSPSFFMVGTGIGLVYSVFHLRARLEDNHRLNALLVAGLLTIGGIGIVLAAWPRFSYYFGILLQRMLS